MSIPKLPTDNLYKFVAIFGIALFIFASAIYISTMPNIIQRITDLEVQKYKLTNDNVVLYEEYKHIKTRDKVIGEDLHNKTIELKINNLELWRVNNLIDVNNHQWKSYNNMFTTSLITSFFSIIIGFYFWYRNLQQYQDKIIKYEALKMEAAFTTITTDITDKTEDNKNEP